MRCIVVERPEHAAALKRFIGSDDIEVIHAGASICGRRYDGIVVIGHDALTRGPQGYLDWVENALRCRLSGAEAELWLL